LFDYETTLVSVFIIICSTICRRHDCPVLSNINEYVFCSYDPQYDQAGCSWCRMLFSECVCLI